MPSWIAGAWVVLRVIGWGVVYVVVTVVTLYSLMLLHSWRLGKKLNKRFREQQLTQKNWP